MNKIALVPGMDYDSVVWDHHDFSEDDLAGVTFSDCTFVACEFSAVKLAGTRFEDCQWKECNLSNTIIEHTRFDSASFEGCKIVGLNFGLSDPLTFGLRLHQCVLRYVNFSQLLWKKAIVTECELQDSDFRGARLVGADFTRSRFHGCRFHAADLARADFSGAEGYQLDPRTENLTKAVFSLPEALSLLAPFDVEIR